MWKLVAAIGGVTFGFFCALMAARDERKHREETDQLKARAEKAEQKFEEARKKMEPLTSLDGDKIEALVTGNTLDAMNFLSSMHAGAREAFPNGHKAESKVAA